MKHSHHRRYCTFHSIVRIYRLKDRALRRLARIVDEADTTQDVALEPAAGLDAIGRGIRLTRRSDADALRRGRDVYEALYALLRKEGGRP